MNELLLAACFKQALFTCLPTVLRESFPLSLLSCCQQTVWLLNEHLKIFDSIFNIEVLLLIELTRLNECLKFERSRLVHRFTVQYSTERFEICISHISCDVYIIFECTKNKNAKRFRYSLPVQQSTVRASGRGREFPRLWLLRDTSYITSYLSHRRILESSYERHSASTCICWSQKIQCVNDKCERLQKLKDWLRKEQTFYGSNSWSSHYR